MSENEQGVPLSINSAALPDGAGTSNCLQEVNCHEYEVMDVDSSSTRSSSPAATSLPEKLALFELPSVVNESVQFPPNSNADVENDDCRSMDVDQVIDYRNFHFTQSDFIPQQIPVREQPTVFSQMFYGQPVERRPSFFSDLVYSLNK